MTTGNTPVYGFVYPFGDETLSNTDDLWQEFAYQVEDVITTGSTTAVYSSILSWSRTPPTPGVVMAPNTVYTQPYDTFIDETSGGGRTPGFDISTGFVVPLSGLWSVDASSRFYPGTTPDTSPHIGTTQVTGGGVLVEQSTVLAGSPIAVVTVRTSVLRWFTAGTSVRGTSISTSTTSGETLVGQGVRLSGPMNVGIPSGSALLRYPEYPVGN